MKRDWTERQKIFLDRHIIKDRQTIETDNLQNRQTNNDNETGLDKRANWYQEVLRKTTYYIDKQTMTMKQDWTERQTNKQTNNYNETGLDRERQTDIESQTCCSRKVWA